MSLPKKDKTVQHMKYLIIISNLLIFKNPIKPESITTGEALRNNPAEFSRDFFSAKVNDIMYIEVSVQRMQELIY